jgi:DNA repair ATPase RecN
MPTQEERLTTLEQNFAKFHETTVEDIHIIEENTTILLGVIRHQGRDISRIFERLAAMDQRLEAVEQRLGRLETIDQHLKIMDQRLGRLETKFDEHTGLLTQILERLAR